MLSLGVYEISQEWHQTYIGITKRNISTRVKENERDAKFDHPVSGLSRHIKHSIHKIASSLILYKPHSLTETTTRESCLIITNKLPFNTDKANLNNN